MTILVDGHLGSGVIYKRDGIIITNEHVVRSAKDKKVKVAFADGQQTAGQVQAADAVSDIAIVKVERSDLPAADFQHELPAVGSMAIAIGSPLGFENSITVGVISGLNRVLPAPGEQKESEKKYPAVDVIQTDAAINPGNSGGALLDGQGRVVGINEAYVPPTEGAVSIGFAIPSATATDAADQLLRTGKVQHAYLGLQVTTLTPEIAEQLNAQITSGVLVLQAAPDSPAEKAGISPGDIIRTFDGTPIASDQTYLSRLRKVSPGDEVTLTVRRGPRDITVKVTTTDRPG
ncbi:signal protein PDZ [Frankia sp. CcI49]|uniref:S1C family serine protease n=1 Tax=Frankia sp. CcI49 TaxID=1745382 RepID=UPI000978A58F|nr:trypsin-like peptidase domain-containing protein [Frankia sp. CcI49]ONH55576.1 signal protein PDZ [Frankia sp. CcI49]